MTPQGWTAWKLRSLDVAEVIDAHRAWPKFFFLCLLGITFKVTLWYMALPARGTEESAFAAIVFAAMTKAFDWYAQSGRDWSKRNDPRTPS